MDRVCPISLKRPPPGNAATRDAASDGGGSGRGGWVVMLLAGALVVLLLRAGLSHTIFRIYGDPALYFDQLHTLRSGYVAHNFEALVHSDAGASPVQLMTEGGFAFLLWACRAVDLKLPFVVNGFLAAAFVATVALLVLLLAPDARSGRVSALILLAVVFGNPLLASRVWSLSQPFRDTPAHLLAFAGLLAAAGIARRPQSGSLLALLAGLCLGWSAWFRAPNGLLIVPGLLLLLLAPAGAGGAGRTRLVLIWAVGVGIGLLPLLAQNVLEGKGILDTGTMREAVRVPLLDRRQAGPPPWLRLAHLPATLPKAVAEIGAHMPGGRTEWLLAVAIAGALLDFRRVVPVLCAYFILLVLYSSFSFVAWRYLIPCYILLPAAAAVGCGVILHALERWSGAGRALAALALLLAMVDIVLVARSTGDLRAHRAGWLEARRFETWLRDSPPGKARFITYDTSVKVLVDYFGHPEKEWMDWFWPEIDAVSLESIGRLRDEGVPVHFISRVEGGVEQPSWWKDSLLNHVDLAEAGPAFRYDDGTELRLHAIEPPQTRLATLTPQLRDDGASASTLVLLARALRGTNRWQDVELQLPPDGRSLQLLLQSGPNIVPLEEPLPKGAAVRVCSDAPLPSFLEAFVASDRSWEIDFTSYMRAYSHSLWCDGEVMSWGGFRHWERDWGGYGTRFPGRPEFYLPRGASIRMPRTEQPLRLEIHLMAVFEKREADVNARESVAALEVSVGSARLPARARSGRPLKVRGFPSYAFVLDLTLPPNMDRRGADGDLVLDWASELPLVNLHLLRVGFAAEGEEDPIDGDHG